MTVGLVGLGIMGGGMARNLLAKGHDLTVWNRTRTKADSVIEAGARLASNPAELASQTQVILICVSDTADVEMVVQGPEGILTGLQSDSVVVDHSTISPAATRGLAAAIGAAGSHFLDAPVSGGAEGAASGTLSVMVGGEVEQLDRVRSVLEAYASSITHMGPAGSGQMAKLVNQVLVVVNQLAVSEALLLAKAGGLDLPTTLEAVAGGAAGSWMLANRGPMMIRGDWRPGFTIDLQQKDLRLVLAEADRLGLPLPATSLVFQLYRGLQARGLGAEGNHALVKALEELGGPRLQGE